MPERVATRMFLVPMQMTFDEWMSQVNAHIYRIAQVSHLDIPDWDYADAWDDSRDPEDAAREALVAADFPFEEYLAKQKEQEPKQTIDEGEKIVAWLGVNRKRVTGTVTKYLGHIHSYEIRTSAGLRVVHANNIVREDECSRCGDSECRGVEIGADGLCDDCRQL